MGQSIPRIPEKLGIFCLNSWGEAGLGSPRLDFISIISWWGWSWDFPWMEFPRFARDYLDYFGLFGGFWCLLGEKSPGKIECIRWCFRKNQRDFLELV